MWKFCGAALMPAGFADQGHIWQVRRAHVALFYAKYYVIFVRIEERPKFKAL